MPRRIPADVIKLVEAVDRAAVRAGQGDAEWNMRFRVALVREGLTLRDWMVRTEQPDIAVVVAPEPVEGPGGWRMPSGILWSKKKRVKVS